MASRIVFFSSFFSRSCETSSSSLPSISERRSSFPSQSTLSGSSIDTSRLPEDFLMYISISFSMHLEA